MGKFYDLSGQSFGKWNVLYRVPSSKTDPGTRWKVRCDCGNEAEVKGSLLRRARSTQCQQCARGVPDLCGEKFGRLTVQARVENTPAGRSQWSCICECGNEVKIGAYALLSGHSQSCGCLQREELGNRRRTHGLSKTIEYRILNGMKGRCYNPNYEDYEYWGGKGIKVCDRWLGEDGILNFITDRGKRPSPHHTIERINNDGDYTPENTCWMLLPDQGRTTSNSKLNGHVNEIRERFGKWSGTKNGFAKSVCGEYQVTVRSILNCLGGQTYPNGDVLRPD